METCQSGGRRLDPLVGEQNSRGSACPSEGFPLWRKCWPSRGYYPVAPLVVEDGNWAALSPRCCGNGTHKRSKSEQNKMLNLGGSVVVFLNSSQTTTCWRGPPVRPFWSKVSQLTGCLFLLKIMSFYSCSNVSACTRWVGAHFCRVTDVFWMPPSVLTFPP